MKLYLQKRGFILLIFLLLLLSLWVYKDIIRDYWYYSYYQLSGNNHPTKVFVPSQYSIIGVDVSRYQEKVDWERLQVVNQALDTLSISFVIAKATEGLHYKDPFYNYHLAQSKKHSTIYFGAYHYFHPSKNAVQQAKWFLQNAKLKEGNILPVIDIEELQGKDVEEVKKSVILFCNYIEQELQQKPIIYCNRHFLLQILGEDIADYPIWIANYGKREINIPKVYNWCLWQFTDEGKTFATASTIDINVLNTSTKLEDILIK